MTKPWRIAVALVLVVVGATFAGVLWLEHHGEGVAGSVVGSLCGPAATSGCTAVKRSPYSEIAGWPTAAVGFFYYGSLLLLLLCSLLADPDQRQRGLALALLLCAAGCVVDLFLLGVQAFALHAFCPLCLLSYLGSFGGLIVLLPARRHLPALVRTPFVPGTRLLLGSWAAGIVILLAGVAAAEVALDDREILADPARAEQHFVNRSIREFQRTPVHDLNVMNAPTAGPANAPIRVVVFSDFLCPWCQQLASGLSQYLPQVQDRASISFKHYPLDQSCNPHLTRTTHAGSCVMALGGVCAAEQGRFWQYHNSAFSTTLEKASRSDALSAARQAGLDMAGFESCLDSSAAAGRLARDVAEARAIGVLGTPTVVVNGKRLSRAGDLPLIVQVESKRLGLDNPEAAGTRGPDTR